MKTLTPVHLSIKNNDIDAFEAFMDSDSTITFNYQLQDIKGLNYLQYFEKHWTDNREDDRRMMLIEKTGLKPSLTKEEEKALKEEEKKKKADAKQAKKAKKKEG